MQARSKIWLMLAAISISALGTGTLQAQSAMELSNDAKSTNAVLTVGLGQGQQRYSPLSTINTTTVKRLVPVWNYSFGDNRGQESQPLVYKGVMYVTTHDATHAIDTKTGRRIWSSKFEYPPETPRIVCCGIVNRGAALYDGILYRATLDAHVIALNMKDGTEIWRSQAIDFSDGYSMTMAPLIANGIVITGISGGEYGIRGFIDGWDPKTGAHLWRRYTVPAPGEKGSETWPGDTYKHGGAPTWITGTYDPDLDLVYWGVGNGGPWNAEFRKGDNLYIGSVLALRPKTGEIVWYYQFSPNDPYDYDGVNENIIADVEIDGKVRKVILHADRNGFLYVIDRTNGELLKANQYIKTLNWSDGVDMATGRPVDSALTKKMRETGEKIDVWPSAFGGKNWFPMSYSPKSGMVYANTLEMGMSYKPVEPKFTKATFYFGIDLAQLQFLFPEDGKTGYLRAIDPLSGKVKWEVGSEAANWGGTMVTGGDLVFTGTFTGQFKAYDSNTGEEVWSFQTGSGIIGQPMTWEEDGIQYISIASGIGGAYRNFIPVFGAKNTKLNALIGSIPEGGSIWTFALQ
ncbi:MAG: PQQ-dependent dehydrogenase, methanol/ethanol family [Sneathiella sp.]|nr:PQQ-dependent dehydrogenase, methanol/ethanol family [Sneathiella sp.]